MAAKQDCRAVQTASAAPLAPFASRAPPRPPAAARAPTPTRRKASCAPRARKASTRTTRARRRALSATTALRAQWARWCRSRRLAMRAHTSTRLSSCALAAQPEACARAALHSRGRAIVAPFAWPTCRSQSTDPRRAPIRIRRARLHAFRVCKAPTVSVGQQHRCCALLAPTAT